MSICLVCGMNIDINNSLDKKKCTENRIHQFPIINKHQKSEQVASVLVKPDFKIVNSPEIQD